MEPGTTMPQWKGCWQEKVDSFLAAIGSDQADEMPDAALSLTVQKPPDKPSMQNPPDPLCKPLNELYLQRADPGCQFLPK